MDLNQVGALCSGSCATDLQSARTKIAAACAASTDVIVYSNIAYPATFIVDQYSSLPKCLVTKIGEYGRIASPQDVNIVVARQVNTATRSSLHSPTRAP